jgi:NDP-sugar pyrophosphorylase family protein
MKAMILAAGLGTRLRPLTNDRPKALVAVAGHTLLEIALDRLRAVGVREVIINAHYYREMIVDFLKANNNFDMHIEVSCEKELLDTGGGLKKAAHFFLDPTTTEEPFLLHNVDVISTIDLTRMIDFHLKHNALVTLAVQERATSRHLLFDEDGQLCGRRISRDSNEEAVRNELVSPVLHQQPLAFSGIHVISPRLFAKMTEEGAFSIIDAYLRLAALGERIVAFRADEYYWRDLGRPESIAQADRDLNNGIFSLI